MSVYEKLLKIQMELNAPRSRYNKFGNYNYRSCEDILEGVKPLLNKFKATLFLTDDIVQMGERIYVKATATFVDLEDGSNIMNTAYAREPLVAKGSSDSQITGATSSYARKYALNGLFCIDDSVDDDTTQVETSDADRKKLEEEKKKTDAEATAKQKAQIKEVIASEKEAQKTDEQKNQEMIDSVDKDLVPQANVLISAEQIKKIKAEMERTGITEKTLLNTFKVQNLSELTDIQYVTMMNRFAKTKDKA